LIRYWYLRDPLDGLQTVANLKTQTARAICGRSLSNSVAIGFATIESQGM
jgi:hypothetical protein